jgi:hypothetical protein
MMMVPFQHMDCFDYSKKEACMDEKKTDFLENVLGHTHIKDFDSYCREHTGDEATTGFSAYFKDKLLEKHLTQQAVFLRADIPERYGYKLLSGEKHTRQRDVILRICYAGELSLEETQRALKKYGMPTLYAKVPRDALLMILFNDRPGDIIQVNALLKAHDMVPLRTSGLQD